MVIHLHSLQLMKIMRLRTRFYNDARQLELKKPLGLEVKHLQETLLRPVALNVTIFG